MAIPPLIDTDIDQDSALKTVTVMHALRDRANWNQSDADNSGAGIDQNIQSFLSPVGGAFGVPGHDHSGNDAQGANIPAAGIAPGAASLSNMFQNNSVSTAKIDTATMNTSELANGAILESKMSGRMGQALSGGPQDYHFLDPPGPNDDVFDGDTMILSNPKGAVGVVCGAVATASGQIDFFVRSVTGSTIRLGLRAATSVLADDGTWDVSARVI